MIIYSFDNEENRKVRKNLRYKNINLIHEKNIAFNLEVNMDLMKKEYGFSLSEKEIEQYKIHYAIWQDFYNSNEPVCFIVENLSQLKLPIEESLKHIASVLQDEDYEDWDIYFPFDAIEENAGNSESGYLLGYRWGAEGYMLKRSITEKLLSGNIITRSVDDKIIELAAKERFEIFYEKADFFEYIKNLQVIDARNEAKKRAIYNLDVWQERDKTDAITLFKSISKVSQQLDIDVILAYGSLLGQVRHGGIMPWDDDIDLAINRSGQALLLNGLQSLQGVGCEIFYWGWDKFPYCKVWHKSRENIPGFKYSFPFIDIWFYEETENEIVFYDGYRYLKEDFYPLQNTSFEGCSFKFPYNPLRYLDNTYKNWKTHIEVFSWCHQYEKNSFPTLKASINVDHSGRIIT